MPYVIRFLRHDTELGTTPWDRGFASAKAHAEEKLPIFEKSMGATRVEVLDDDGNVRFALPRNLRAP